MDLVFCRECNRDDVDPLTHPDAFTPEHAVFNRRAPYSTPITLAPTTGTLSPAQLWARQEVLAARAAAAREAAPRQTARDEVLADLKAAEHRQPTSIRDADTALSTVRTPDDTRRLFAQQENEMLIKLALAGGRNALERRDLTDWTH